MARALSPIPLLLPLLALLAAAALGAERTVAAKHSLVTAAKSSETMQIKNKLHTAQDKVSDLISRLDSVSDDATRAKNEIHSTLVEVSRIAEQLAADRCADIVEQCRADKQRAAASHAALTQQRDAATADADELRRAAQRAERDTESLRAELAELRAARAHDAEQLAELRDKLHWANAVANETAKYELVAERLQALLGAVTERGALLQRLQADAADAAARSEQWRDELLALAALVRDAERDFVGGYQNAAVQGLRRQTQLLQQQLADALQRKDTLAGEKGALQKALDALHAKLKRGGADGALDAALRASARDGGADASQTWVGTLTLCILSVCTGAVLVFLLSNWQAGKEVEASAPGDKLGFSPSSSGATPGAFQRTSVSPLQFVKTPASRGSSGTPRRY